MSQADAESSAMVRERNSLLSQVVALQRRLDTSKSSLSTTKEQLSSLQQQLWSAQGELAAGQKGSKKRPTRAAGKKPVITPAAAVSAPSKQAIMNPASRYFGMFTEQAPFSFSSFDATAQKIGSRPNSVGFFSGWDQAYRGDAVTAATR